PEIDSLVQTSFECFAAKETRHEQPVLNDSAIHIHHPQRAVRPIKHVHRTKSLVCRSQEFGIVVSKLRRKGQTMIEDNISLEYVPGWLAHKSIALKLRREVISTIDHWAARS